MTAHRLRNRLLSPSWPLIPKNVRRKFRRKGLITARQMRIQNKAQKAAMKAAAQ